MTLADSDVLDAGPARPRRALPKPRVPRWLRLSLIVVLGLALAGVLLAEVAPWGKDVPSTGLRVLVDGPAGLTWVEVDGGARTPATALGDRAADDVDLAMVVGSGVVVQYRSEDAAFADSVVGYVGDERPIEVGEADLVAPASGTSVWLVVDGDPPTSGGVALASAYGTWRSRVFSVPPRVQIVGANSDGLVAVRGGFRARELILWDPQLRQPIRDFGLVIGVREVGERYVLVTSGCLTSGCSTAMIDTGTGSATDVEAPDGWREVGQPRLVPEGVAMVVADGAGRTALALGAPDELAVVADLRPGAGAQVVPGPNGWLMVPLGDGDVVAWRNDLDGAAPPRVELAAGEQLIGVSS